MNDDGIEPVERFKYDGRYYSTVEEARYAKNVDALRDYLDGHPLYVTQKGKIKAQEVLLWLKMSCPRVHIMLLPDEPQTIPMVNIADPDDTVIYCSHEWKSAETDPSEPSYMICRKCGVNGDDLYLGNKNGN